MNRHGQSQPPQARSADGYEECRNGFDSSFEVLDARLDILVAWERFEAHALLYHPTWACADGATMRELGACSIRSVGVYALYYVGDLDFYKATRGEDTPIYVGSAVLAAKRKGGKETRTGRSLHSHLVLRFINTLMYFRTHLDCGGMTPLLVE